MYDFSIEAASDKIPDNKTKEYFAEVLKSYISGNYRSAIVMLWAVAIADIIYKLQHIESIFIDETATDILQEIKILQEKNPRSSEWELQLIEKVNDRIKIFEMADYENLINLQKIRHLCAHPVLTENYNLYKPNQDHVRSFLRNTLEGLLLKPPIVSNKIFNDFLIDLENNKDLLIDSITLQRYLVAKYLNNMNNNIKQDFIKRLWKIIFRLNDDKCILNREINFKAFNFIFSLNHEIYINHIKENFNYYSQIGSNDEQLDYLFYFLGTYPKIFSLLDDSAKILIENHKKDAADYLLINWFLKENILQHLISLQNYFVKDRFNYFDYEKVKHLFQFSLTTGNLAEFKKLIILLYLNSGNFSIADNRFDSLIQPYIEYFSNTDFFQLFEGIEKNPQTYARRHAISDHKKIKEFSDKILGESYDYSQYVHFYESVI